jgi:hypothetical protein
MVHYIANLPLWFLLWYPNYEYTLINIIKIFNLKIELHLQGYN